MRPTQDLRFGEDGSGKTLICHFQNEEGYDYGLVNGESGEFMQFTGLKDKNGKEIYEGDIYQQIGSTAIGIVEWSTVRVGFLVHCRWNHIRTGKIERRGDSFETPLHNDGNIIGNIYENPELLK